MTILTLDRAAFVVAPRTRRRSWLERVIDAVYESRMRSAQAVIARYRGFMPISPEIDPRAIVARGQRR